MPHKKNLQWNVSGLVLNSRACLLRDVSYRDVYTKCREKQLDLVLIFHFQVGFVSFKLFCFLNSSISYILSSFAFHVVSRICQCISSFSHCFLYISYFFFLISVRLVHFWIISSLFPFILQFYLFRDVITYKADRVCSTSFRLLFELLKVDNHQRESRGSWSGKRGKAKRAR
jgi:hypothetical protein